MAANRRKTIEYMLPNMGLASDIAEGSTYTDSGDTTIYIPETTSRAFVSCILEVYMNENYGTAGNDLSGRGIRGSCDTGTTWTTASYTETLADTGENWGFLWHADMTAEFTARFGSGTSGTFRYGVYLDFAGTNSTFANVSGKLYITYEFDDSSQTTLIKTVRIPIECLNGRLSNTAQAITQTSTASNQLPALNHATTPFLPETSKTIRQAFIELWANTSPTNSTDCQILLKIDSGGSETTFGRIENGLSTPINYRQLYDVTSVDWTSAHELYGRHSVSGASDINLPGGWLTVTYEYAKSSSTILNSIILPCAYNDSTTTTPSADTTYFYSKTPFWVEEPTTITLVQSAFVGELGSSGSTRSYYIGIGGQTQTAYSNQGLTGQAGAQRFVHRFDSGGNRGSGHSLARGYNELITTGYSASGSSVTLSGFFILNYTSGADATSPERHNKSILTCIRAGAGQASTTGYSYTSIPAVLIMESNYWLNAQTWWFVFNQVTATAVVANPFLVQRLSGEGVGDGYVQLFLHDVYLNNASERALGSVFADATASWRRYPDDTNLKTQNDRLDVEGSRNLYTASTSCPLSIFNWTTYHSITFTKSGTVSGYTGDGSGITVRLYRVTTDRYEYIGNTTTSAGGTYSFTWYDNVEDVFAEARQDATHCGRSDTSAT